MKEEILQIIEAYKTDFDRVNSEERYKWEAIGYYKQKWNIDAEDFTGMLTDAFKKSANLLAASMYYPLRMVIGYAKEEPEKVRELFRVLHNEKLPFVERYERFRAGFDKYVSDKKLNHYQDLRAISVYLTFEYPEKYFMYKYKMYKEFKEKIGYVENSVNKSDAAKYENYMTLCNQILEYVKQDEVLQELSRSRLDATCYRDEALHILTHDIIYFGSRMAGEADTEGYWPTFEEYDPDVTSEDWKRFIIEVEKPDHLGSMIMLKCLMDSGGEASCKQLAHKYGGTSSSYVGCSVNLGKRAKKYFDLPPCMDNGQERFFTIPFLGKYIVEDGNKTYTYKLRPELLEALKEIDLSDIPLHYEEEKSQMSKKTDVSLNTILYGPPGTGKTYNTVVYAVAIIENRPLLSVKEEEYADVLERYNAYKAEGLIEFTTFHQSYGYEEFIEGIKPIMETGEGDDNDIQYEISSGLFKSFCERAGRPVFKQQKKDIGLNAAPTIWKVSLEGTGDNPTRTECMANGHIRIGWDSYGEVISGDTVFDVGGKSILNAFMYKMKVGDIVLSCYSATTIDAIGVVTGEYEWHDEYENYKRLRNVNWIVKDIREDITDINNGSTLTLSTVYRLNVSLSDVMKILTDNAPMLDSVEEKNYVFVIDEINRGNISKIFGELITLIEASKRVGQPEGMKAKLPYSQKPFGVPDNVYIIGTMNTADRSIAAIDTALRRRFKFKEMLPDTSVLEGIYVEGISIRDMLEKMNKRISVLYDREHTLGHAYFVPLKFTPTLEALGEIFADNIIPLLQEYFYEDYEKIRMVLGDNNKSDENEQFVRAVECNYADLFGNTEYELDGACTYEINQKAFGNIEAYRKI